MDSDSEEIKIEEEENSFDEEETPVPPAKNEKKNLLKPPKPIEVVGKLKISKPGIIYLSTIPPGMNVKQIREYFEQFGEIHRSFLQPDKTGWKGKKRNQIFTEGWIEFRKRRYARSVANSLNNTPVGGKKRKVYHDFIWNIKYLQGFRWTHLNERLAYERISKKQKLRTEISAAKREVSFFSKSVDMSKKLKRKGFLNTPNPNDLKPDTEKVTNTNPKSKAGDSQAKQIESSRRITGGSSEDRLKFFKSFFGNKN